MNNIDITIERDEYDEEINVVYILSQRAADYVNSTLKAEYALSENVDVASRIRTNISLMSLLEEFQGFTIGLKNDNGGLDTVVPPLH